MATQNNTAYSHFFARYFSIVLMTFFFILVGTANSADLRLAWDANSEPDLTGYRAFCSESSGHISITKNCDSSDIDCKEVTSDTPGEAPPTTCEFNGLEEGKT